MRQTLASDYDLGNSEYQDNASSSFLCSSNHWSIFALWRDVLSHSQVLVRLVWNTACNALPDTVLSEPVHFFPAFNTAALKPKVTYVPPTLPGSWRVIGCFWCVRPPYAVKHQHISTDRKLLCKELFRVVTNTSLLIRTHKTKSWTKMKM